MTNTVINEFLEIINQYINKYKKLPYFKIILEDDVNLTIYSAEKTETHYFNEGKNLFTDENILRDAIKEYFNDEIKIIQISQNRKFQEIGFIIPSRIDSENILTKSRTNKYYMIIYPLSVNSSLIRCEFAGRISGYSCNFDLVKPYLSDELNEKIKYIIAEKYSVILNDKLSMLNDKLSQYLDAKKSYDNFYKMLRNTLDEDQLLFIESKKLER